MTFQASPTDSKRCRTRPTRRDEAASAGSSSLIKMIQSSCRPVEQGRAAEVGVGSSSNCCCSRRATRKRCDMCAAPARFCSSG